MRGVIEYMVLTALAFIVLWELLWLGIDVMLGAM
jgi:hypothetical protein